MSSYDEPVLGADNQFSWHLKNIDGHYYYGYKDSSSMDLTKRTERKEFLADLNPLLDEKMVLLGKLTAAEIDHIAGQLKIS